MERNISNVRIWAATSNFMYMASDRFNLQQIGERAMPIRRLLDAGVLVSLSSDNVPFDAVGGVGGARWPRVANVA